VLLEDITGTPWSKATVNAAESGWSGLQGRLRQFDADEITAFSLALKLPITWFFLPPDTQGQAGHADDLPWIATWSQIEAPTAQALTSAQVRWMLFTTSDAHDPDDVLGERIRSSGWKGHGDHQARLELERLQSWLTKRLKEWPKPPEDWR
jgi:hypothetical protein